MNVYLKQNAQEQVPGDLFQRWVLRTDLAPVPRTVEMTLQVKDGIEQRLAEGATFWTGRELLPYRVVKSKRDAATGVVQGKDQMATFSVTGLLSSCAQVSFRRPRAVIRENAQLGELFRACGATATIAGDLPVRRFTCFAGQVPSFHLAQAMQEESSVLVLRGGQLSIVRVADLFRQQPADIIDQTDSTELIESEYLQRHEIPAFFSLADDGSFVFGNFDATRAVRYLPRTEERALRNMTRVLVTRRVVDSQLAEQINAGDILQVAGQNMAVITGAHVMQRGKNGAIESNSKFWCGVLSQ